MKSIRYFAIRTVLPTCLGLSLLGGTSTRVSAQVVPGTGTKVAFDDFEDPTWSYEPNLPKASSEQDNQERQPGGVSSNSRWY